MQVDDDLLALPAAVLRDLKADQCQITSLAPQLVLLMGLLADVTQLVTLPGGYCGLGHSPGQSHRDTADLGVDMLPDRCQHLRVFPIPNVLLLIHHRARLLGLLDLSRLN